LSEKDYDLKDKANFKIALDLARLKEYRYSLDFIKSYKQGELILDNYGILYAINLISLSNYSLAREMLSRPANLEIEYYINITNKLYYITTGLEKLPEKNPFLAAFFSSIIPGSGKFYSDRFFDGFFSLSFITSTAIFAGLYFSMNGITSWQGWTLAATGFVFYIGDIYGAYKAAERYNRLKEENLNRQKEELLEEIDI